MRARTMWAMAVLALVGALLVTSPSGGTEAQWRESRTATVSGPSSDTFEMTATDVPDPLADGASQSTPRVDLTNLAQRQTSWVDVRTTRLAKTVSGDANDVLGKIAFSYTFGSGACGGTTQATYWAARSSGQVADGTTYTRPQSAVSGATLAPGATGVLCPKVVLPYPSTAAGTRDAYLGHAGRAVDITTVVRQSTQAPATWLSTDRTATSRFRIGMPTPTAPGGASGNVCRRTTASGQASDVGYYGGFFFAWPDSSTSAATPSPAMAGGWEMLRRTSGGAWESWKITSDPTARSFTALNSDTIDPQRNVTREFKLRGYPFVADRTRYVESDWIARARNQWSVFTDRWTCDAPIPNPDKGPVNMP